MVMSTNSPTNNVVHIEIGSSVDEEAIVRLRPQIEDFIRESGIAFRTTKLFVSYNANQKTFDFEIKFYA